MQTEIFKKSKKPNVFIVGAAKSGTTSLSEYLKLYSDVFVPEYKEPFFFIDGFGVRDIKEYREVFSGHNDEKVIVDASTGYLFDKSVPQKILDFNSDAKVVILLRNPIDVAFSYWKYMRANGHERLPFRDAISPAVQKFRRTTNFYKTVTDWPPSYWYAARAMYYGQVAEYIRLFGEKKVKVYIFEEFIKSDFLKQDLLSFLGVAYDDSIQFLNENASGDVSRFFHFLRYSRVLRGVKSVSKKFVSKEKQIKIRKWMIKKSTKRKSSHVLSVTDRNHLKDIFIEDVKKLESLLGRPINWKDFNETS